MKKAIVIGAGAGGCAAAVQLSEHFQVTLVEAGADFRPFTAKLSAFEPLRRSGAMVDPRMISLLFSQMRIDMTPDMTLVKGRAMGGTTTLATGNYLRYDKDLAALGVNLDEEFAELEAVVPHDTSHRQRWSKLTRQAYEAFDELGFSPQVAPKMVDIDACRNCGRCVLGCPHGAKWTADRLLAEAAFGCVEVRTQCRVERLIIEGGQVKAVACREGLRRFAISADVVVLAAGGIGTPRLLERSGIDTSHTFFEDPVLCVAVRWPGAHADKGLPMPFIAQRDGYILAPYFDYLSFFFAKQWRLPASDIFSLMIKFKDEPCGYVGAKHLDKPLTEYDFETMARAEKDCKAVIARMGKSPDEAFLGMVNAGHPGGCLPLTAAEAHTLHNPRLPENLYVADSSLFVKSMGNPPILTIMALAKKVAKAAAQRFA